MIENKEFALNLVVEHFLINVFKSYSDLVINKKDDLKDYLEIFYFIEAYKFRIESVSDILFLTEIQNSLYFENDYSHRLATIKFLEEFFVDEDSLHLKIEKWNSFFKDSFFLIKKNIYQNNTLLKPIFKYYVFFEESEEPEPFEMFTNSEILVGDTLDFEAHYYQEIIKNKFGTIIFKVIKRKYSVQFSEMSLELEPSM